MSLPRFPLGVRGLLSLLALVLALVTVPAAGVSAQTDRGTRADLVDIEDEVMCIVCERPLSTSAGDAADDQRGVIQGFIDEGLSKEQVKDRLVAEYGDKVLVKGSSPIAAAAPVLAALVGGASIWLLLRRRLTSAAREGGPSETATGAGDDGGSSPAKTEAKRSALTEPTAEDDARIDAELSER